jgi:hypothetical protein
MHIYDTGRTVSETGEDEVRDANTQLYPNIKEVREALEIQF